ncbi:MAG: hypothetical protein GXP09_03955 [Gammaproteobacteria bacterium]|nr:hypothetical protein [Gammaproteobacteria bacterium]
MKNRDFLVWMLGFPVATGLFIKMSGIGTMISGGVYGLVLIGLLALWLGLGYSMYEGGVAKTKPAARAKPAARTKKAKKR